MKILTTAFQAYSSTAEQLSLSTNIIYGSLIQLLFRFQAIDLFSTCMKWLSDCNYVIVGLLYNVKEFVFPTKKDCFVLHLSPLFCVKNLCFVTFLSFFIFGMYDLGPSLLGRGLSSLLLGLINLA